MTSILSFPKLRLGGRIGNSCTAQSSSKDDKSNSTSPLSDHEHLTVHPHHVIDSRRQAEADCLREIDDFFRNFGVRNLPQEQIFRYACFHRFDAEKAIEGIGEDFHYNPYLGLKMNELKDSFEGSCAVFPLPHLSSRGGSQVIYLRPSRFIHKNHQKIIESLCYVLNDLSRTEEQCRNGVTVIADMQDIRKEVGGDDSFMHTKEDCKRLMEALQGQLVPIRVEAFLMVSPPTWFASSKTWKWMKSAMTKDFAKRVVHILKQPERLSEFFLLQQQDDYELYLPDDLPQGLARASEICEDYVDLKMMQEAKDDQQ